MISTLRVPYIHSGNKQTFAISQNVKGVLFLHSLLYKLYIPDPLGYRYFIPFLVAFQMVGCQDFQYLFPCDKNCVYAIKKQQTRNTVKENVYMIQKEKKNIRMNIRVTRKWKWKW